MCKELYLVNSSLQKFEVEVLRKLGDFGTCAVMKLMSGRKSQRMPKLNSLSLAMK